MIKEIVRNIVCFVGFVFIISPAFAGVNILNTDEIEQSFENALNHAVLNTTTSSLNKDYAGRNNRNSVFGQLVVGQELSTFSQIFSYPYDTRLVTTTAVNTATITQSDSLLVLQTGTNSTASALFRTKRSLQYVPGKEAYCKFTAIFTTPKVNSRQEIGLFDEVNGFSIGTTGTAFAVFQTRDSAVLNTITQANFNRDKLDGTGDSGFTIDLTKGNIFRIAFGYLGFAPIYFEVFTPQKGWIVFHVIEHPNSFTYTNCNLPYLKFSAKVSNSGNTSNIAMKTASVEAGIIDGGGSVAERIFARSTSAAFSSTTGSRIVVYHNKTTFGGIANRIEVQLQWITGSVEGTKPLTFQFYRLVSSPTGGTFSSHDTTNSAIEVSYDTTVNLTNAEQLFSVSLGKSDNFCLDISDANIRILPDEYLVVVYKTTGAGDLEYGTRWKELF